MKISINKLNALLARQCKSISFLRYHGVSPATIARLSENNDIKPSTLGRIASALCVDPVEIMEL